MLSPRKYLIQTLGCQMNSHDSERIAGSLDAAGYVPARSGEDPDLIVFNTCAVRENADNKLYGHLSFLAPLKRSKPELQIAIGGCLAQKDRGTIIERAPYVDVVFGTHNLGSLPSLLERARIEEKSQVEIKESLEHFPSVLPARRHSPFSAWVSISVGCNNTCTFCIVPALRGREKDRPAQEILDEINALVDQGVTEVTLLGQNVRSYRSERYRAIINRVRTIIPDSTITTDLIVGFPGESEEDFQATLDICAELKFLAAYSFKYSKRPGTPAASMPDQVPEEIVSERYDRLHALLNQTSLEVNQAVLGKELEVLITDIENGRAQGKSRDFRLVHFELNKSARPGDIANVKITDAKPHFIFGSLMNIRETRGGLAFESRKAEAEENGVFLGVPQMKSVLLK